MRQGQDESVPLVELLDAAAVSSPGRLVDLLHERGDAVVVDALGRLAAPAPVAERLRAEQAERERAALEAAARAEEDRLNRLRAYQEQREEQRLARLREQSLRDRIHRIEQASGLPFWQLELEVQRSRSHASSGGMMLADKAVEDARPVGLDAVEEFVRTTYGLEGDA